MYFYKTCVGRYICYTYIAVCGNNNVDKFNDRFSNLKAFVLCNLIFPKTFLLTTILCTQN